MKIPLRFITILTFCALIAGCSTPGKKARQQQAEAEMQALIKEIDTDPKYQGMEMDAFVDEIFVTVLGRDASDEEIDMFTAGVKGHGHEPDEKAKPQIPRSSVLAYAMMLREGRVRDTAGDQAGRVKPTPEKRSKLVDKFGRWLNLDGVYSTYRGIRGHIDGLTKKYIKVKEFHQVVGLFDGTLDIVRKEKESVRKEIFPAPKRPLPRTSGRTKKKNYQAYFGYVHAHSGFSFDSDSNHERAYPQAKAAGLDFFALTDHSEALFWPPLANEWQQIKDMADEANKPGDFVALHGFEWSNPLIGHLCVINSKNFITFLSHYSLESVYDWVEHETGPHVFATFNHPGRGEAENMLGHFDCSYNLAVGKFVGVEVWNKSHDFTAFFHGAFDPKAKPPNPKNSLNYAISQGWYLAPIGGQDNHDPDWGTRNDYRIGALAEKLTRKHIVAAFLARRIYATEDKNLALDFRAAGGYPMGSRIKAKEPRTFELTVADPDQEPIKKLTVFRDGVEILSWSPPPENAVVPQINAGQVSRAQTTAKANPDIQRVGNTFLFNDVLNTSAAYYYVLVEQERSVWDAEPGNTDLNADQRPPRGDQAVTAPIWFVN